MKKVIFLLLSLTLFCFTAGAQTTESDTAASTSSTENTSTAKKTRRKAFRPSKDQVTQGQVFLKAQGLFAGEATGRYSPETRTAIKAYQEANQLDKTGRFDRETLEKMGIALTEAQVADGSAKTAAPKAESSKKPKRVIFRASKDQVIAAQKMLKAGGMYDGEETGRLNDATRAGLKQYQGENALPATGTLNQVTLEKMGIELTEKQKANAAAASSSEAAGQ